MIKTKAAEILMNKILSLPPEASSLTSLTTNNNLFQVHYMQAEAEQRRQFLLNLTHRVQQSQTP